MYRLRTIPFWLSFLIFSFLSGEQASPLPPVSPEDAPISAAIPSQTPPPFEEYDFMSEFMKMLSVLGVIIVAMLLAAWALKRILNTRLQQVNASSAVKIIERRALNPKAAIYVLDVLGNGIVVAESPAGVQHVANLPLDTDLSGKEEKEGHEVLQ